MSACTRWDIANHLSGRLKLLAEEHVQDLADRLERSFGANGANAIDRIEDWRGTSGIKSGTSFLGGRRTTPSNRSRPAASLRKGGGFVSLLC
jgi:hypothetical protein